MPILTHVFQRRSTTRAAHAPPPGPHAPHTAAWHPVHDPSASGTTSWPSRPTRTPRRPACPARPLTHAATYGGRRVRKRSHAACRGSSTPAWVVGGSLQRVHPAPGRAGSAAVDFMLVASEPSSPRRSECRTREARRGFHAPPWPETAPVTRVPATLPSDKPTVPHLPQHGLIWRPGRSAGAAPSASAEPGSGQ